MSDHSEHRDGDRFRNPSGAAPRGFGAVLKWKFGSKPTPWPNWFDRKAAPKLPTQINVGQIALSFVGHATLLIQTAHANVLTDPVFSDRASPLSWAGPKRVRPPGIRFEELPRIDVVLVSHNHYDHLDIASLRELQRRFQPLVIAPLGNAEVLRSAGITKIKELDWWERHSEREGLGATLVPAQHWSARGMHDRNRALWGGFVLEADGQKIYFAGDTGYAPHFTQIRERLGTPNLALLPIGAYEPRWFMKDQHMNPEDAVRAHLDLGRPPSVAIHFGSFQLTDEGIDDPVKHLAEARAKWGVGTDDFRVLDVGETAVF